jgi:hypothetical protein
VVEAGPLIRDWRAACPTPRTELPITKTVGRHHFAIVCGRPIPSNANHRIDSEEDAAAVKYLPEIVVGAVILIVGAYVGWAGVLIDAQTVRIHSPIPDDSTAWRREECFYLSFRGITMISGEPRTDAAHQAEGSQCPRFEPRATPLP